MPSLVDYQPDRNRLLKDLVQSDLRGCQHLQEAAQACTELLFREFREWLVLGRIFVTIPYGQLPPRDQSFAAALASSRGVRPLLKETTNVLSLLGTCGVRPEWNDRLRSAGHLAIPLVSASFVDSIPMIARLMSDMNMGPAWLSEPGVGISTSSLAQIAGVFYVEDAATGLDGQKRPIVSDQEFVKTNAIKTVFGLGGGYLNGSFATMIFFARETVTASQAEGLMPLIIGFKIATMSLVADGALWGATAGLR